LAPAGRELVFCKPILRHAAPCVHANCAKSFSGPPTEFQRIPGVRSGCLNLRNQLEKIEQIQIHRQSAIVANRRAVEDQFRSSV
jgi:hypothetical protein